MSRNALNPGEELLLRIKAIMVMRVVIITGLVALFVPFQQRYGFAENLIPLALIIGVAYFLSIIYAVLFKLLKPKTGAAIQMAGDLFVVAALVYATGGIQSPFSFLFIIIIFATSLVLPQAGCYLVASGASILYGLLIDLEFFKVIHPIQLLQETSVTYDRGYVFFITFLHIASYYVVAYLSNILSNRLKVMREELAMASMDLRDLQAFHSSVVQDMGNGLLTTDLNGKITSLNQAAEDILGYPLMDCLGLPAENIFEIQDFIKIFNNPDSVQLPMEVEGECYRNDGNKIFIRMKISRFSGHGIPVKGYICVFEDLTEVKEIEEKYYQAQQLAVVGRFSAGLAHEIRNPLASLSGSIQVLSKGLKLEDSYQKLMKIVLKETDRLNDILTEFLNYSQPKKLNKTWVDLKQLICECLALLKNSEEYHKGIELNFDDSDQSILIDADEEQIKQMIWNLCINALQAMGPTGRLNIDLSQGALENMNQKEGVLLTIEDDGPGIPKDQLDKIFDPFYTTKENGIGLGLANVYQTVQQNGGIIHVDSQENQGTRFQIHFPKTIKETEPVDNKQ